MRKVYIVVIYLSSKEPFVDLVVGLFYVWIPELLEIFTKFICVCGWHLDARQHLADIGSAMMVGKPPNNLSLLKITDLLRGSCSGIARCSIRCVIL